MKRINNITPSREQQNCIEYNAGDLLINGVPGAGKSIVLLKRALKFYQSSSADEKNVVMLMSYNNTLKDYTKDILEQADIDGKRMTIVTLDSYCWGIHGKLFGWCDIAAENARLECISCALQNHFEKNGQEHRFYSVDEQFWSDEFLWIKQKNIRSLQEYIDADRTGRGARVRITRDERKFVFELFQEYCDELKRSRISDDEDVYQHLLDASDRLTAFQYKHVLVDEAQDLSFIKLKVAKLLARDSITIAADKAQKIYNTSFTWKELGIDIRGNASKTLHKTFRSTKQIVQLAESLSEVNRYYDKDSGEYTDPVYPTILGEDYPCIIQCPNLASEKKFLITLINAKRRSEVTIGILYRNYLERQEIAELLAAGGIQHEEIKKNNPWSLRRPGVKLVTLHSSKGLEFDVVVIPFFSSQYYPPASELEKADTEQLEELKKQERNLLYVGMTRAKSTLYFTYSGTASPFLSEFDPEYYNYFSSSGAGLDKPERTFSPEKPDVGAVKKNDTITAHLAGETYVRTLKGSMVEDPDKWAFIGSKVGDQVRVAGHDYVVDGIKALSAESPWAVVCGQLFGAAKEYAQRLSDAGVPAASTVGSELMGPDGDVIAEAELAWEQSKIVYLRKEQQEYEDVWKKAGWTVITEAGVPDCTLFERED